MKWLAARLAFLPTLLWNVLLGRVVRVRNWWDPIDDHVIVGAFPFAVDAERLASEVVGGVVNTCEEYRGPRAAYEKYSIAQIHIPTIDFQPPSYEDIVAAIAFMDEQVAGGKKVYVHCKAGRGRSATVALCWLIHTHNMTPDEAQQRLIEKRSHVSRKLARREVVQRYYQAHVAIRESVDA